MEKKISNLQAYLTVLFVGCLLISNVIGAKQVQLPFGISVTGAVIVFPVTYILSDLFSEVYGYKWSRITCYLAFGMNAIMLLIFSAAIAMKAPAYWGNQEAFETILGSTFRVSFASLLGFVCGDFVNDRVFQHMKRKHDDMRGYGLRAIISSVFGEFVDSMIFMGIAFAGQMQLGNMALSLITYVAMKVLYEIIILPLNRYVTGKVLKYEQNI